MSGNDPRADEAARWFALARDDLTASTACLVARLQGIAAYHAQQSAEKAVKGLLVLAGTTFRRVHDLDELAETALPVYPELRDCLDRLRPLTSWGVDYRYPGADDIPLPEEGDIRAVLTDIGQLLSQFSPGED
jgi:HEPN domain-containing protein